MERFIRFAEVRGVLSARYAEAFHARKLVF